MVRRAGITFVSLLLVVTSVGLNAQTTSDQRALAEQSARTLASNQPLTPGELPVIDLNATDRLNLFAGAATRAWQFNVRKTFATKIDAEKPANISYVTSGKKEDLYNVDVAVGVSNRKDARFHIEPAIEWHRNSTADKPTNKLSAGSSLDGKLVDLSSLRLDLRGALDFLRNFQSDVSGATASLLLSLYHPDPQAFDVSTIRGGGAVRGTFYPYAGFERWHHVTVGSVDSVDANIGVARFEAKILPGNTSPQGVDSPFEIGASYTYRHPFGQRTLRSAYHLVTADANYFVDPAHHVAIGFSYQNGADPDKDYAISHQGVLSLKFKI